MSLISMHGAWLSFSDAPLLDNAELHIEDNERVCLVGRNGAGKSTLMKILNREQGLDDGRIIYEQDLIVARLQQDPPRNIEGTVYDFVAEGIEEQAVYLKRYHEISRLVMTDPSDRNLNELAKVQEQLEHHNLWQLENRINEVLAQLGLDPNAALSSLSGGWLRKAALGRALVSNPRVLLLDEPTNHLDLEMRLALTMALQEFSGAVVVVSHDRHLLKSTTDEFLLVADGQVLPFDGDLEDYARWLVDYRVRQAPASSSESNPDKTDKRVQRQAAAALRQQLAPHKREADKLEKELGQLHEKLAAVETRLGESDIYEAARKDELRDALAEQAKLKSREADLEERWLLALETLEALQAELEAAS